MTRKGGGIGDEVIEGGRKGGREGGGGWIGREAQACEASGSPLLLLCWRWRALKPELCNAYYSRSMQYSAQSNTVRYNYSAITPNHREQWTNLHITVHCALEMCSWWWCRWCNKSARWVFWNCCYHGGAPWWWAMIRPLDTFARFRSSSFLTLTFSPQHFSLWQEELTKCYLLERLRSESVLHQLIKSCFLFFIFLPCIVGKVFNTAVLPE